MEFPTLYSRDKTDRLRFWNVCVTPDCRIVRKYGLINGKHTVVEKKFVQGKNIGKSNETTPFQQACFEAKSLHTKQIDEGYSDTQDDVSVKIFPMLAHKWNDKKKHISFPCYVQPKLDGIRMLVGRINGEIRMISRTGKVINNMEHVKNELSFLQENEFLDGENYNHTTTFENITSLCRTCIPGKDMTQISFHVFDYFVLNSLDIPYYKRLDTLRNMFSKNTFRYLKMVPTKTASCEEDIFERVHPEYTSQGYEGTIIRNRDCGYQLNERSVGLLKFKDFETAEFEIIDAIEATGRDEGTVIWICQNSNNKNFSVRPRGSLEERKEFYRNRVKYIGKKLTVQYQNLTKGGIPRFPVGLAIRDYE